MYIKEEEIALMDKAFRRNLINSVSGYKSVNLIGTINGKGMTNLAVFSSMVHLGAHPPLQGFVCRPDSVERHSLENIRECGVFTVNQVNSSILEQAHQTSARYPRELSEFQATGLTEEYIEAFKAPFVRESRVKIGMELVREVPILENNTHFLIAKIVLIEIEAGILQDDGRIDLNAAKTVTVNGLDSYSIPEEAVRMSYAKPSL